MFNTMYYVILNVRLHESTTIDDFREFLCNKHWNLFNELMKFSHWSECDEE